MPVSVQRVQKEPVHNLWATTRATAIGITSTRRKVLLLLLWVLLLLHHGMMHHAATHHGVVIRVHHVALVMASRTTVRRGCEVRRLRCGRRGVPLPTYGNQVGRRGERTHTSDERKTNASNYGGCERGESSQLKNFLPPPDPAVEDGRGSPFRLHAAKWLQTILRVTNQEVPGKATKDSKLITCEEF